MAQQQVQKKKRRGLRALLVVVIVLAVIIGAFAGFILLGKARTGSLTLDGVSLADAADGVYTGSYSGFRWSNTVQVTVKAHRITEIDVVKEQVIITPETAQALKDKVLAAQNTQVDAVSGATVTSKAYLKAVENALHAPPA